MTVMNYECENCGFKFRDESLIFYMENNKIIEKPLTLESSKKMSNSKLSGYLYVGYCKSCGNYIKTYVPEINDSKEDNNKIVEKLEKLLNTKSKLIKILIFNFNNTTFQQRRDVLSNNHCPNCGEEMSLLIDEFHPCPKCLKDKIKTIEN